MGDSSWMDNNEVRGRLADLLRGSGALLEWQVHRICSQFASAKHQMVTDVSVGAERIIYSEGTDDSLPPREIDQCVTFYSAYSLTTYLEIEQQLTVPIECKHRESVAIFTVMEDKPNRPLHVPAVSSLGISELFHEMFVMPPSFLEDVASDVVLVEFSREATPRGLYKEQVIDNAAASLYDFVRYDLQGWQKRPDLAAEREALEAIGIRDQLEDIARLEPYSFRRKKMYDLLKQIDSTTFQRFNSAYNQGNGINQTLALTLPVVCMDGPLYKVTVGSDGTPDYQSTAFVTMPVRVRRWLPAVQDGIIVFSPELPVIVTTPVGLSVILEECRQFHSDLRQFVLAAPDEVKERALLSGVFDRLVGRRFPRDFRSDIGLGWLERW